jgi:holliday junction DNA helicase RuvB
MTNVIRPTSFDDITGQSEVIERLSIMVAGCKDGSTVMPHVLIDGPPGLGKTTIAGAIANALGVNLYTANAANIRSVKNILPYLMNIEPRSVLFLDEIHRLPISVEEFLYPVMEDFRLDITVESKIESIDLPLFTMVGATTSGGSLSQPFYDRFTIKEHLTFYSADELSKLARSNADKMGINISDEDLLEIAKRSKGTPRILNARLKWYKSYVAYAGNNDMSIDEIFNKQGIDSLGMDKNDRAYVEVLQNSRSSPLGLKSISSLTGISMETIENSIEPFMMRMGYVIRTQKGRLISAKI